MVDEAQFQEQLDRLERVWARLDAPILAHLRPGLSDSQIDELMAQTGLSLPHELRLWWRWHDGAVTENDDPDEGREISPGSWIHLPLSEAIAAHDFHDGSYKGYLSIGAVDLADLSWRPGLFPFTRRVWRLTDVLAADTVAQTNGSAPVVRTSVMGIDSEESADSVGDVLRLWVELLESGRYGVDENGSWEAVDPFFTEESRFRRVI